MSCRSAPRSTDPRAHGSPSVPSTGRSNLLTGSTAASSRQKCTSVSTPTLAHLGLELTGHSSRCARWRHGRTCHVHDERVPSRSSAEEGYGDAGVVDADDAQAPRERVDAIVFFFFIGHDRSDTTVMLTFTNFIDLAPSFEMSYSHNVCTCNKSCP